MSIITPVGSNNFSWVPKGMQKVASTGIQEDLKDPLYQAALRHVKAQEEAASEVEVEEVAKKENPFEKKDDKKEDAKPSDEKSEEKSEEKSDKLDKPASLEKADVPVDVQKAVSDLVEKANKAEEIAAKVEEAVSGLEDVAQEIKDAVGVTGDAVTGEEPKIPGEVDEIELEISDEAPISDVGSVSADGVPGNLDSPTDELVKETGAMGTAECEVCAASPQDFVKVASLSNDTKKKLRTYWEKTLGYPKDYVDLLLK